MTREEAKEKKMTVKLTTTLRNIEKSVHNKENAETILRFFEFMKKIGTSERYQNNNLKAIIAYSKFLTPSISSFFNATVIFT